MAIPLSYNFRNVIQRPVATLTTAVGIALTVAIFIGALALAHGLYTTLGKVQAQTLSGTFYHSVKCLQPPYLLRFDENRRPLVVFNVEIEKEVSAA